jgi:hypothetical protein
MYGLLLNGFGTLVLAAGLLRRTAGLERDTYTRNQLYGATFGQPKGIPPYVHDKKSLSAEVRKTVDTAYGILFLAVGFSIQMLVLL